MFRPPLSRYIRPVATGSYPSNSERTNESEKTKKKNWNLLKSEIIKNFLDNTSLHGLNFIGSNRITLFER